MILVRPSLGKTKSQGQAEWVCFPSLRVGRQPSRQYAQLSPCAGPQGHRLGCWRYEKKHPRRSACNETAKLSESSPCNAFGRAALKHWRLFMCEHPLPWDVGCCFLAHTCGVCFTVPPSPLWHGTVQMRRAVRNIGVIDDESMSRSHVRRCSAQFLSTQRDTCLPVVLPKADRPPSFPSFPRRSGIQSSPKVVP